MNKIKNIFKSFKKVIEKFPVTIITVFILTISNVVFMDSSSLEEIIKYVNEFSLIFCCSSFFIETIFKDKKRYILYIVGALISIVLTYFVNIKDLDLTIFDFLIRVIACYTISLVCVAIYYNYKKTKMKFNEYICRVFIELFKVSIIYAILAIGLSIISNIFTLLILDDYRFDLMVRLEILLSGLYYFPSVINSLTNIKKDDNKFMKAIMKYVLEVLVIISFIVIYVYILKIIVLRDIPSNEIFRILTLLFVIGYPIWTANSFYKEENILDKINSKLPLLFIPFILLQIYSIGTRIYYNGVTEARYLCIMFIILEIIYIIIYISNRKKEDMILFVIIILTIISTIVPVINMSSVSDYSQYHNLNIYKSKKTYTKEEKDKIVGAYSYLVQKDSKRLHKVLTDKEIEEIKSFKTYNYKCCDRYNKRSYSASLLANSFDVSGYSNVKLVRTHSNGYDKVLTEDDFKEIELYLSCDHNVITRVDLSREISNYIKNKDNFKDYVKNHNEIVIDKDKKLVIGTITIRYDLETEEILSYTISGYLLEK